MSSGIKIALLVIVGVAFISDTIIFAFEPSAANSVIEHTSTLVGIGASAFIAMRSQGEIKKQAQENGKQLQVITKNVNGNLSEALRLLAMVPLTDEQLEAVEAIEQKRRELDDYVIVNRHKVIRPPKRSTDDDRPHSLYS